MQDKSFLQAVEDLENRISSNYQETLNHMLRHGTTVADATLNIEDEKMRAIVGDMLIAGQISALLKLMRDMGIVDQAQYDEFTAFLRRSIALL
jgi:hypothetical protein